MSSLATYFRKPIFLQQSHKTQMRCPNVALAFGVRDLSGMCTCALSETSSKQKYNIGAIFAETLENKIKDELIKHFLHSKSIRLYVLARSYISYVLLLLRQQLLLLPISIQSKFYLIMYRNSEPLSVSKCKYFRMEAKNGLTDTH